MTIGEALAEFVGDLVLAGKSEGTIRSYRSQLGLRLDASLPLTSFDRPYCRALMTHAVRTSKPNSARTIHGILCAFAAWNVRNGYLALSPMQGVPLPRQVESRPSALSGRQLEALACACRTDRERLLLALFSGTGLRLAELASARWQDIDWERHTLTVVGKGNKRRAVLLPKAVLPLMEGHPPSGLIIGVGGSRIWMIVKDMGRRAGMPWLHPHNFRHTYATNWLLKGGSAFHLQTLGGWADMKMIRSTYGKTAVEQAALDEAARLDG